MKPPNGKQARDLLDMLDTISGWRPHIAEEPAGNQLAGVKLLLDSDRAPYTDFSALGGDGRNIQQRLMLSAFKCTGSGRYEQ